jgi:hypothetical protein
MSTHRSSLREGSIKAAWIALSALAAAGLTAMALRGRAGAEGIPAAEPLFFSGELVENGTPVDGTRPVVLQLWSSATATDAASKRCETTAPSAAIVKGSFRVALDATCVAQVRSTPDLWIEPLVGGRSLGRRKIGAAPYAVEADHAASATRAAGATGALEARLAALEQQVATMSQGLGGLVQSGTAIAGMSTPGWTLLTGTGKRTFRQPIKFTQPFQRAPTVLVSLSEFDIINAANARLIVSAQEVTPEGFTTVIETWADGQVYHAGVNWLAIQK